MLFQREGCAAAAGSGSGGGGSHASVMLMEDEEESAAADPQRTMPVQAWRHSQLAMGIPSLAHHHHGSSADLPDSPGELVAVLPAATVPRPPLLARLALPQPQAVHPALAAHQAAAGAAAAAAAAASATAAMHHHRGILLHPQPYAGLSPFALYSAGGFFLG